MADINQIITLGIGTPADVPHFILLGLNPNGNVTPITGEGTLEHGPPVLLGTGLVVYGGGRLDAGLVHHAPDAPASHRPRPSALTSPRYADGIWVRNAPAVIGRGTVSAALRASGTLRRSAPVWKPGHGTVDFEAIREEEAFLLAVVSRLLLDD